MADNEGRAPKIAKVEQNHSVIVDYIDLSNMDHYVSVKIHPDRMFPTGVTKTGIKLSFNEFNKGCKVLGERSHYRLLTPLTTRAYAAYLNKVTEDFLKHRNEAGMEKTVVQVRNQSPFRFKSRNFVCARSANRLQVFELFSSKHKDRGFAAEVDRASLPFIINWCGEDIKPMAVNDHECLHSLVKIIAALDELQPNVEGLGVCVLAEFSRFLIYNLLVDGEMEDEDEVDLLEGGDNGDKFRGYKQMILVLHSEHVETGKSFLCEVLARLFYGSKHGICSIISFDSARKLLGNGEPVIIDDYNNDNIGMVLISRSSKAIWGQSDITIRGFSTTPLANLLLCTNEEITDLKVEGKSKMEIFKKFSVIHLGEEPLSKSACANKGDKFKEIILETRNLRNNLPSLFGLSLQICDTYITTEEMKEFSDITKHERLANLLKNCKKLYDELNKFCDKELITKSKSLRNELETSCLTKKSELAIKYLSPELVVQYVMNNHIKVVITKHDGKEGIAIDVKPLSSQSWYMDTMSAKKDGAKIFQKMRTRQMYPSSAREYTTAAFLGFQFLKPAAVFELKNYALGQEDEDSEEEIINPEVILGKHFEHEIKEFERLKKENFGLAEQYILKLANKIEEVEKNKLQCENKNCNFVAKNKGGLTTHMKKCKNK